MSWPGCPSYSYRLFEIWTKFTNFWWVHSTGFDPASTLPSYSFLSQPDYSCAAGQAFDFWRIFLPMKLPGSQLYQWQQRCLGSYSLQTISPCNQDPSLLTSLIRSNFESIQYEISLSNLSWRKLIQHLPVLLSPAWFKKPPIDLKKVPLSRNLISFRLRSSAQVTFLLSYLALETFWIFLITKW